MKPQKVVTCYAFNADLFAASVSTIKLKIGHRKTSMMITIILSTKC